MRGVSEDVLDAIARGLQLDDVERSHLFDLVRAAKQRPSRRRATPETVRPGVQRVLDTITESAAFVRNGRLDILSANRLGYSLYSEAFANPQRPTNLARFVFLDPRSREFYLDWDGIADAGVGSLRAEAGRDPYDQDLTNLIGELSMRSQEFRIRWATHDVRHYRSGTQPFQPSPRWRPHAQLRRPRPHHRPRTDPHRLHRRAGLALTRRSSTDWRTGRTSNPNRVADRRSQTGAAHHGASTRCLGSSSGNNVRRLEPLLGRCLTTSHRPTQRATNAAARQSA